MNHMSRFQKYWLLPLTVILMVGVLGSNCQTSSIGTMTGNDGKTYKTVKIGDQWWLAENLRETKYRDGTLIPVVTDNDQWTDFTTGARCVYDNDESNANTYGYLYNWYAVDGSRSLAPAGWRVPTDEDWAALEKYLGSSAGGKMKTTGTTHWKSPNTDASNESGFSALPGGYRGGHDGKFGGLGSYAAFWSATGYDTGGAWARGLGYDSSGVGRSSYYKQVGFSVRLVRE